MKALFINFASNNSSPDAEACLACVSDEHVVSYTQIDHRLGDDQLMPTLEKTLAEAGSAYSDLTQIACVLGPGGFTSLRMAVSLANVLADQLQIPVAGVHLSDVYYRRVSVETCDSHVCTGTTPVIWLHSTKKTAVFVRTFNVPESSWTEASLVPTTELEARSLKLEAKLWTGELLPEHRSILESLGCKEAILKPLTDILPSFLASQTYAKNLLQPWYGRGY